MTSPTALAPGPAPVRLERASGDRMVAGVAAGLARFTGLPVLGVRAALVGLGLAGGAGVAAYAVFWVFLPPAREAAPVRRGHLLGTLALLAGLGTLALLAPDGSWLSPASAVPLTVAVAGVVLVWQQADESRRSRWRDGAGSRAAAATRVGVGALLLVAALLAFLALRGELGVARAALLPTTVVVVALAVLSSPWWVAVTTELRAERRERIRSQERAEVAAHLHDSVLQTLALIQKAAGSPAEVQRLARGQERSLRRWLYTETPAEGSLRAALQAVAAEVEESHGVPVELVVVGDARLDEHGRALVAAAREAVVNAARHSGAPAVDVYAESADGRVEVFVRDRGRGFDPSLVASDRHGLAGSVTGRMDRHGGSASVRSAPGDGTEVRLVLPRD